METVKFIQEKGWDALTEELGIRVTHYPEQGVSCLKYSQIDSPKSHPVVMECRGLILDTNTLEVYCRPFTRFFNWGEVPEYYEDFSFDHAIVQEKVDGSLIKIWYHQKLHQWFVGTSGTAFAESDCQGFGITFAELVYRALRVHSYEEFNCLCSTCLDTDITYLFELTAMENRVVTRYEGTSLWFLGARHTDRGIDFSHFGGVYEAVHYEFGAKKIREFDFETVSHCIEAAKSLPDLQEGYVCFDTFSGKRTKIKSPAYVAAHKIRSDGLTPNRIVELVLTNETDEYFQYFPEDRDIVEPYILKWDIFRSLVQLVYLKYEGIEDQKDFAFKVKDYCYSGLLFSARKKKTTPEVELRNLALEKQSKLFKTWLDTLEDVGKE